MTLIEKRAKTTERKKRNERRKKEKHNRIFNRYGLLSDGINKLDAI